MLVLLAPVVLALGATPLNAADWPQWRGPNRDGVSAEADWSINWPATGPKRLWTTRIGEGTSAVAVVGNRIYTQGRVLVGGSETGAEASKEAAICLDADTGKVLWSHAIRPVTSGYSPHSTPTVDSGKVYVYATGGELLCLDGKTGQVLWENRLGGATPEPTLYGHALSPLVMGSIVIVACNRKDGTLFGIDSSTGAERWHSEHIPPTKVQAFWSSPVAGMIDGKPCVVYHAALSDAGCQPSRRHDPVAFRLQGSAVSQAGGCLHRFHAHHLERPYFRLLPRLRRQGAGTVVLPGGERWTGEDRVGDGRTAHRLA